MVAEVVRQNVLQLAAVLVAARGAGNSGVATNAAAPPCMVASGVYGLEAGDRDTGVQTEGGRAAY